jgi:hypothetical protein
MCARSAIGRLRRAKRGTRIARCGGATRACRRNFEEPHMIAKLHRTNLLAALALALAACGAEHDSAEEPDTTQAALGSNGPFTTKAAVIDYWSHTATGGAATQIFIDGHLVYYRSGVGPAFIQQYFVCNDKSGIKAYCTNIFDGFLMPKFAIPALPLSVNVYVDGRLYLSRNSDQLFRADVSSCYGDMSLQGPIHYYIVADSNDGVGPMYPGNTCANVYGRAIP